MKDFYDLEILSRTFAFEGKTLAQALQNTFQKRGTNLPVAGLPVAFTSDFYDDVEKKRQWTGFCAKNKSYVEKAEFKAVIEAIRDFLAVPLSAPSKRDNRSPRRGSPAAPGVETVVNAHRSRSSQDCSFRRTLARLLKGSDEDLKTFQELMWHASSRLMLDVYAQALSVGQGASSHSRAPC